MVSARGVEPPRVASLAPEASVSTIPPRAHSSLWLKVKGRWFVVIGLLAKNKHPIRIHKQLTINNQPISSLFPFLYTTFQSQDILRQRHYKSFPECPVHPF